MKTCAEPVNKTPFYFQVGYGNLVVAIVDVNDFPPAFLEPWTPQNPFLSISVPEEQPKGTIVHTFRATDNDSNIDRFRILNPSKNKRPFEIDADTGNFHREKISISIGKAIYFFLSEFQMEIFQHF